LSAGVNTITITVTDTAGNKTVSSFTVTAPESVGGSISGNTTVCSGSNSSTLTLSGNSGSVTKWQSSTVSDFSSNVTDIANTTTSLTATNLTATTYYRAVTSNGGCAYANSSNATITVDAVSVGGTISGGTSVCTGTNSTILTLSGKTGNVTKWQYSSDNFASDVHDIANTTTSLTATNLTSTTYYRAVVTNGVCSSANSSIATISVDVASIGGTVAGSTSVCTGTNSTTLTLSGKTGNVTKWQSSTASDFSSNVTDIANTTTSLTATNLTATTYYRAVVTNGVCSLANSSVATISVDTASVGGTVAGSTSVCTGTNSTTLTLSGKTGNVAKWQSSTASDFSSNVTDIANTTTSLTATNLTATTYYRAVVTNGVCSLANSSVATISVDAASVGGTVAGSTSVCAENNSTTLSLTGNIGAITKWQYSSDNFVSDVNDIVNNTSSLTATNLVVTTYYRAVITNGTCSSANSNSATITVNDLSVGGTISGSTSVCTGTNSTTLTLSGNTGNVVKWQYSSNNFTSDIHDIVNTTTSLTTSNLTSRTYYRAIVKSGSCSSANSSVATIAVDAASVGGTVAGGTSVCTGTNSTTLTLSGKTGNVTKWQYSSDNFASDVHDIANTTSSLTATNLTATTYYRAVVTNGVCSSTNSSVATISVDVASIGGTVSGSTSVCRGSNSTTLTLSGKQEL